MLHSRSMRLNESCTQEVSRLRRRFPPRVLGAFAATVTGVTLLSGCSAPTKPNALPPFPTDSTAPYTPDLSNPYASDSAAATTTQSEQSSAATTTDAPAATTTAPSTTTRPTASASRTPKPAPANIPATADFSELRSDGACAGGDPRPCALQIRIGPFADEQWLNPTVGDRFVGPYEGTPLQIICEIPDGGLVRDAFGLASRQWDVIAPSRFTAPFLRGDGETIVGHIDQAGYAPDIYMRYQGEVRRCDPHNTAEDPAGL